MELNTAASVISYISKIEQDSGSFYENWADKNDLLRETFISFTKENKKNESEIKRVYYSVISDALETGFSFKGLKGDVKIPNLSDNASLKEILQASIVMEESIQQFYFEAAKLSKSLLADVPRAMERVAKKRNKRKEKLASFLQ
jgi:hypothetical protein